MGSLSDGGSIETAVRRALDTSPIIDIHTHLYAPQFGKLLLWGIDELLTYHYLVAEFFRVAGDEIDYDRFWSMSKSEQADLIWEHLFVRRSPISEACRGVVTCLKRLGLDLSQRKLTEHRRYFAKASAAAHLDRVLEVSGVRTVVMTNDPLDELERAVWQSGHVYDDRFKAVLRLDRVLVSWQRAGDALKGMGYDVQPDLSGATIAEVRRFLNDWVARVRPVYVAASLPPSFRFPDNSVGSRLIEHCVLPVVAEHGLPFALMIGCRQQVNPKLRLAGDAVGKADMTAVVNLCAAFPNNRFLCTVLSRENQHELAVIARKFHNLHIFGCWWFLNTPSLTEEITRLRMELLGHSFTPQHSDARVLEQLIYKWDHSKAMLARVLTDKYADLLESGWAISAEQIEREVANLLGGSAMQFMRGDRPAP
ncbi:MAG TPA: glucuronate isomerase [Phycisphaerae bacterium]|nr:glucuronate isomerase [Phycisphaerae bacterium]